MAVCYGGVSAGRTVASELLDGYSSLRVAGDAVHPQRVPPIGLTQPSLSMPFRLVHAYISSPSNGPLGFSLRYSPRGVTTG